MSMKQTSLVWEYFLEKGDLVTCTKCPKAYKLATAKSSKKPLRYHLKTKHGVVFDNAKRVFSAGGLSLTKLHSKMSDSTLDKLMFLKFFFALKNEHIF